MVLVALVVFDVPVVALMSARGVCGGTYLCGKALLSFTTVGVALAQVDLCRLSRMTRSPHFLGLQDFPRVLVLLAFFFL